MSHGSITTGAPNWLSTAFVIFASGLVVLAWGYRRHRRAGRLAIVAGLLKVAALAGLAACLVEPLWTGSRAKPGANLLLLVADNSQSMTIRDRGSGAGRGEDLRALLTADPSPWQVRLEQDFDIRRYVFDSRLRSVPDFHELSFDGQTTELGSILQAIAEQLRTRPIAGILLFTDGNATDLPDGKAPATALPPIYPVIIGRDESPRDLSIINVAVTQTAFEDAPVTIRADVQAEGFTHEPIVAQVLDETGTKHVEETQQADETSQTLTFRLHLQPTLPGVSFYTLRVSARRELDQFDDPSRSTEATLENNRRIVVVDRGRGPYHVLYVSGRPNWEFKFLRRAIDEDRQVRLVGMIRLASREPKFSFRSGDVTNPLFRGFKNPHGDDTERYDQPVLVRLNPLDESELLDGFPKTREQLYAYHAIVIDDLEAAFFTHEQMALLRRFVSERGGGFLMLGGQESFRQGKYERTPIEELLPVYLDRPPQAPIGQGARLQLTREGWLQPWVRLRANESDERQRLDQMPEFMSINRVRGIKPGASVLATLSAHDGTNYPALVAQRFSRGRCAALLIGDLWRWAMRQDPEDRDLEKSWRQLVRWLVSDVPERVEVRVERSTDAPNDLVDLMTYVRSETYEPQDNAAIVATVRAPDGKSVRVESEPSLHDAGSYQAVYAAREAGAYRAQVVVTDGQGAETGKAEAGWASDPAADEFRTIQPNRRLLQQLAEKTGGAVIDRTSLESFAASLSTRRAPITEQWSYPLWHRASVFLFAIACLLGEWGLRRWKGLP
jgi:uncharacterized membrane protein